MSKTIYDKLFEWLFDGTENYTPPEEIVKDSRITPTLIMSAFKQNKIINKLCTFFLTNFYYGVQRIPKDKLLSYMKRIIQMYQVPKRHFWIYYRKKFDDVVSFICENSFLHPDDALFLLNNLLTDEEREELKILSNPEKYLRKSNKVSKKELKKLELSFATEIPRVGYCKVNNCYIPQWLNLQPVLDRINYKDSDPCDTCPLREMQSVYPDFIINDETRKEIDILFVGMNPYKDEIKEGKPFIGKSGKILRQLIDKHCKHLNVGITNVVMCFIPDNADPDKATIQRCFKNLKEQIKTIQPKIIVGLGSIALQSLLGKEISSITKQTGKILYNSKEFGDIPIVIAPHPSFIARNPKNISYLENAIVKAVENISIKNESEEITTLNSFEDLMLVAKRKERLFDVQDVYIDSNKKMLLLITQDDNGKLHFYNCNPIRFHFYAVEKVSSKFTPFKKIDEVEFKTHNKLTFENYYNNRRLFDEIINSYKENYHLYESDIPPTDWIFLKYRENQDWDQTLLPEYKIAFFDIEVHADRFPDANKADYPISTLSLVKNNQVYAIVNESVFKTKPDYDEVKKRLLQHELMKDKQLNIIICQDEKELLKTFAKLIQDVNVITAWNIFFDINYICNRMKKLGLDTRILSQTGLPATPSSALGYYWIPGKIVVDMLELYKNYVGKAPNYKLDTIAEKELGFKKVEYEGTLYELLYNDPTTYLEYSLVDSVLISALEEKSLILQLHLSLKDMTCTPFKQNFKTIRQLDNLLYQYARQEKLVMRERHIVEERSIPGAFVREPKTGFIPWAIDMDASSMYPSIMRQLNISPETYVLQVCLESEDDYKLWEKFLYNRDELDLTQTVKIKLDPMIYNNHIKEVTLLQLEDIINNKGLAVAPNGALFAQLDKEGNYREGIIPKILSDLITRRKVEKKKMLEAKEKKDYVLAQRYNVRQWTLKILANSLYGASNNSGFRFYHPRLGEAVTTTGQHMIKFASGIVDVIIQKVLSGQEKSIKDARYTLSTDILRKAEGKQDYVFYSDTDSSFIHIFDLLVEKVKVKIDN